MSIFSSPSLQEWYIYLALHGRRWQYLFILSLLIGEAVLGILIVRHVPYTEIDWKAYMQEVEAWLLQGEYDYRQIRGDTGPLVYPAGFLYLFGLLRWYTGWNGDSLEEDNNHDNSIRRAQYVFLGFYLVTQCLVLVLYHKIAAALAGRCKTRLQQANTIWSWRIAMLICCCSKRLHSIYILRLFNDGPAMLFLYASVLLMTLHRWNWACFLFSLAVSIKMNILLFAPGLLLLLLQAGSLTSVIQRLTICAVPQLVLGAPFLIRYPESYLRKAFELDRVFFYKWTVNLKFLPEDVFVSKPLSHLLLLLHLSSLAYFARQWLRVMKPTKQQQRNALQLPKAALTPDYIVYTLMVSNFCGICFARTLHYQFYSWYFHSGPVLLWLSTRNPIVRMILPVCLEYSFLVYPATPLSSLLLQVVHWTVLFHIQLGGRPHEKEPNQSATTETSLEDASNKVKTS